MEKYHIVKKIYTLLGCFLISFASLFAQTTTVYFPKNTYELKPFDGPLANPHKGFTFPTGGTWSFVPEWEYGPGGSKNNQAWNVVTYGSGHQRWDKLNPAKGVYDWTELDKLLDACEKHGMGYALRVFPYSSSMGLKNEYTIEEDYDWTPKFVYEEGAKKTYATLPVNGTVYTLAVPVWDDPIYLQAHKDFAAAMAEKYDGDPRIEYIDVRSFGNWGEWHVSHFDGTQMPSEEVQKEMLSYYASIFHKTLLVLPSNGSGEVYKHALSLGITKRDDGLIATPNREYTLVAAYEANLPTIGENHSTYATLLTNNDIIPGGYLKWTLERWKNVITAAHLTYYVLDQDNDAGYRFYNENKAHVDSMTKVIGYNFRILNAELTTIADSTEITNMLNITVKNTGVAPCFFDVYMVAEFVDAAGKKLEQIGETIRIPKGTFKDEMTENFSFTSTAFAGMTNFATQSGGRIALSLYESEEAYKNGKNPTVRFDNEGIQENNKLLLNACPHEFGEWNVIKAETCSETGLRKQVCTRENCGAYIEEMIAAKGHDYQNHVCSICKKKQPIESIEIDTKQTQLVYQQGEKLDFSGLSVDVVYDDASTEKILLQDYEISGYNSDQVGEQDVTIQVGDVSFVVTVIVTEKTAIDLCNNGVVVYAMANTIFVANAKDDTVYLYNSKGELCDKQYVSDNELELSVPQKGVYCVVVNKQQFKVIVK